MYTSTSLIPHFVGFKRGEASFYPYHDVDQDPWMALIPQSASKRAIENQYKRLYALAEALKRPAPEESEDFDRLLSYYVSINPFISFQIVSSAIGGIRSYTHYHFYGNECVFLSNL